MKNPVKIPTNFRIPKDCRHEFVLFHERKAVCSIYGTPGKRQIEHLFLADLNDVPTGLSLDWIQESVEHLRRICEQ